MNSIKKINKKYNFQFILLFIFIEFLLIFNFCICFNSFNKKDSTTDSLPNLTNNENKETKDLNMLNNNKNIEFKNQNNQLLIKTINNNKNSIKNRVTKQKKNKIKKNSKKKNKNKTKNKFLRKYKLQKRMTNEINKLNVFRKLLKNQRKIIKRILKKNNTFNVIKECGINFLTEIYCQFYKKNYSEKLEECRKLKLEDFKKNCSDKKSVFVIYNLKSATNAYESYRENMIPFDKVYSIPNINIAIRNIIFKDLFNSMLKPIQKCQEIPIEVRLGIIKQRRRFSYNDKHLTGKQIIDRMNAYSELFDKIKILFSDLSKELKGIKLSEEKLVCVGFETAAKRIVDHFTGKK